MIDAWMSAVRAPGPAAEGHFFVGPDNGVFGDWAAGGKMHLLSDSKYMRPTVSQ